MRARHRASSANNLCTYVLLHFVHTAALLCNYNWHLTVKNILLRYNVGCVFSSNVFDKNSICFVTVFVISNFSVPPFLSQIKSKKLWCHVLLYFLKSIYVMQCKCTYTTMHIQVFLGSYSVDIWSNLYKSQRTQTCCHNISLY